MDCSPPGFSVHEIFQARILEWVAFPGDLPNPGIEPRFPALQADSLPTELQGKPIVHTKCFRMVLVCLELLGRLFLSLYDFK